VLHDQLDLTGTKFGCGIAQLRRIHVPSTGKRSAHCVMPIGELEQVDPDDRGLTGTHQCKRRGSSNVPQCGYCQSGQIMSTVALSPRIRADRQGHRQRAVR
jgi:isoquinoline 1-oxidoreductase alpha subunit